MRARHCPPLFAHLAAISRVDGVLLCDAFIPVRLVAFQHISHSCQLVVVIFIVIIIIIVVVTTPHGVALVGVICYEENVGLLLGYVPYGYDAVVTINFVVYKFVRVGMYNWCCCHFCNVEQPEVGIASRSVFDLPLRDEINPFHMK